MANIKRAQNNIKYQIFWYLRDISIFSSVNDSRISNSVDIIDITKNIKYHTIYTLQQTGPGIVYNIAKLRAGVWKIVISDI